MIIPTQKYIDKTIKFVLKSYNFSNTLITRLKKGNGITVNGVKVTVRHIIQPGDILDFCIDDDHFELKELIPTFGELDIIFEDDYLLIINKRRGISCHPTINDNIDTLANHITYYYHSKNQNYRVRIATRLDKNTGGLVLVAKDCATSNIINQMIIDGKIIKHYTALAAGHIPNKGEVNQPIGRVADSNIKREVAALGQHALTIYQPIDFYIDSTLLDIMPITGRTHQIRVHMSHIGHPLVGDTLYGTIDTYNGQFLYMTKLLFDHPITLVPMVITCDLPIEALKFLDNMKPYQF